MPSLKRSYKAVRFCLFDAVRARALQRPLWVHFYLTRRCNLNCAYCSVKDNTKKDISIDEVKKIVDRLYTLGVRALAFFGGEPTLRMDFCEILKYADKKGFLTFFTTNGTLLNEKYIKEIAETGVDYIELSIDSIFSHEYTKKDYARSKRIMDLLIKYRDEYGFILKTHTVLTNKNIDTVIETIKKIDDEYKIPLTVGYVCRSVDMTTPDDESLFFNSEESKRKLVKVVDQIIELKKNGAKFMDPYSYFENMKKFVYGKLDWHCMAGKYSFSVDYDGSVQLCNGMKPFDANVFSIDKDFFKKKKDEIEKTKAWCTKICFSTCHNTTTHMIDHPVDSMISHYKNL